MDRLWVKRLQCIGCILQFVNQMKTRGDVAQVIFHPKIRLGEIFGILHDLLCHFVVVFQPLYLQVEKNGMFTNDYKHTLVMRYGIKK